jgi:hypothetical protein
VLQFIQTPNSRKVKGTLGAFSIVDLREVCFLPLSPLAPCPLPFAPHASPLASHPSPLAARPSRTSLLVPIVPLLPLLSPLSPLTPDREPRSVRSLVSKENRW